MIRIIDILMALLPIILITIALLLACALWIVRRGAASRSSLSAVMADDPFFFPFGEMPTVPRERLMVARDFRAWGIPDVSHSAGVALRRNGSGGRPASTSGTAVVLNFPKRGA